MLGSRVDRQKALCQRKEKPRSLPKVQVSAQGGTGQAQAAVPGLLMAENSPKQNQVAVSAVRPCRAGQSGLAGSTVVLTHMPLSTSSCCPTGIGTADQRGCGQDTEAQPPGGATAGSPTALLSCLDFGARGLFMPQSDNGGWFCSLGQAPWGQLRHH